MRAHELWEGGRSKKRRVGIFRCWGGDGARETHRIIPGEKVGGKVSPRREQGVNKRSQKAALSIQKLKRKYTCNPLKVRKERGTGKDSWKSKGEEAKPILFSPARIRAFNHKKDSEDKKES